RWRRRMWFALPAVVILGLICFIFTLSRALRNESNARQAVEQARQAALIYANRERIARLAAVAAANNEQRARQAAVVAQRMAQNAFKREQSAREAAQHALLREGVARQGALAAARDARAAASDARWANLAERGATASLLAEQPGRAVDAL